MTPALGPLPNRENQCHSCTVLRKGRIIMPMDWFNATGKYHERTLQQDCRLSSLPQEWQRELAALWRLEADVNNGAYLQFLANWGRESYEYASRALRRIGANRMAEIIDRCQMLVDEHLATGASHEALRVMLPNPLIDSQGKTIKKAGSVLPNSIIARLNELSYEFMEYPDDIASLGLAHYGPNLEADG